MFVAAVVGASLLVLIALNAASWLFVKRMTSYLDSELGRRLETVARLASRSLERQRIDYLSGEDRTLLALELLRLRRDAQLQAVHIIDADYRIVASSQPYVGTGEPLHYLRADSQWVARAWEGEAIAGPLRSLGSNRFKVAYAPLHDLGGAVVAVLSAEASADFFELLSLYDRARLVGLLASGALLLLLTLFLLWSLTLLLRTEASLRQAERLATIGHMAATVAHEIRNPLGIIKTTADVLRQRYCPPGHSDELFDFIPQEVSRLNRLVDNFLVLSRGPRLAMEQQRAQEVIGRTIARLRPEFEKEGISLLAQSDENLPAFPFDQDALQQMLLNLLLNSLQATHSGGCVTVTATTVDSRRGAAVRISVHDNGCGIEGDPQLIFEPFYTTKPSGSGLGLAVTKRLIEAHGGWIEVASGRHTGTDFSLYFPLRVK
jgi:signal transduction histidine kinase